jgi:GGDEF domain-containing protein
VVQILRGARCIGNLTRGRRATQLELEELNTKLRYVTCSFGIALSNCDDQGWKGIYGRADAALYEAKTSGKDKVVRGNAPVQGATGRFKSMRVTQTR